LKKKKKKEKKEKEVLVAVNNPSHPRVAAAAGNSTGKDRFLCGAKISFNIPGC